MPEEVIVLLLAFFETHAVALTRALPPTPPMKIRGQHL